MSSVHSDTENYAYSIAISFLSSLDDLKLLTCQRVRGETLDNGDLVELSREIVSENRPKSPVAAECTSVYDKLSIIDSVIESITEQLHSYSKIFRTCCTRKCTCWASGTSSMNARAEQ